MKTLGQRIDERREEIGISMAELGRRTGIAKSAISNAINNPERDLKATSLFAIASALQLDPVWLYTGKTGDEWLSEQETPANPLGRRIGRRLKVLGMSAADLARATGLSKPTLSAIIHGDTCDPRISSLISIAEALQVDLRWLCTGDADHNPDRRQIP